MDFVLNFVLWNFALWIYGCCFWFCFVIYCGLFCGFCFVDLWILCLMSVGLWSLWIFVWCCNSGDGFAQEWSGPAVEALVGEGGDRSEEAEAFAVVRRWSGAASVSHRRWANIGRLDLDHVSRWKWRILSLRRGWPGILEWRCLTTSSFGMAKSLTSSFGMTKSNNLTSSFAPSGLERHGVEPLSHKSKCTRTGKQTCCRLNACVYVHVVIDHVCMCTVVIDVLFVMFCGTLFFTCFTCCDMDLTTQVWWLLRLPQLQAKRREWPITRKKRLLRVSVHVVSFLKSRVCACLCMSFACLCMSVFKGCCACHECFWEGFRFSMTSSSLHFDKRTLSSWFWWWLSLTIHKFQNVTLKTTIHNLSPKPVIDNNN